MIAEAIKTARERNLDEYAAAFQEFRFSDLRHQTITELAQAGAQGSAIQSIAWHMSRRMMEHYSHVRIAAKRKACSDPGAD